MTQISWARAPVVIPVTTAPLAINPIPDTTVGLVARVIVLEPGIYILQTTYLWQFPDVPGTTDQIRTGVTRLFLGGTPITDGAGYNFSPIARGTFQPIDLQAHSSSTVIEVLAGAPAARTLQQNAVVVGDGTLILNDNTIIMRVTPGQ